MIIGCMETLLGDNEQNLCVSLWGVFTVADKVEPKELLEQIRAYLKSREGSYTAGDRELASLFKQADVHLSRLIGLSSEADTPGSKAANNSAQREQRTTPGGTQYDVKPTEARDLDSQ